MTEGQAAAPGQPGPPASLSRAAAPVPPTKVPPVPATWQAAPRLRRLAAIGVAVVIAAVVTRHASLLLLGAPALAALAAARRGTRPASVDAGVTAAPARCFEGEDVEIVATVETPVDEVTFRIAPGPAVTLVEGAVTQVAVSGQPARARWVLQPHAWGRHRLAVVTARCTDGMGQAGLTLQPGPVEVFPHPPPARATLLPADLLRRIGEHTAAVPGAGIEFSGIRGYQPGDRLRDVNWAVTSRLAQPHVNQRAALRAADLVIMIDAFSDVGPPGDTTLDAAVRGAAGLATAYLRTGDRVGIVVLGGVLKWLAPAPGNRQFFRIVEMAFGVRFASEATPDLDRVPRTALPPRALVVLFSPLLDRRALNAVTDLRQRGVSLVVVDVLQHEPPAEPRLPLAQLAVRLWRLDAPTATLAPLNELQGHEGPVTALDNVPSAKGQIVSGSQDGSLRLWDLETGRSIREFKHGAPISAVAVRPDGKRFATAAADNAAKLWDASDGKEIAQLKGDRYAREFAADRTRTLTFAGSEVDFHAPLLHRCAMGSFRQISASYDLAQAIVAR